MPGSSIPVKKLIDTLRKRFPKGATLPDSLDALLTAWADAEWGVLGFVNLGQADAAPFIDVKPAAQKHVLAFASVSCGDQLALWWPTVEEAPRVVVIGAHGEDPLVFKNLPDFQHHLVEARTDGAIHLQHGQWTIRAGVCVAGLSEQGLDEEPGTATEHLPGGPLA